MVLMHDGLAVRRCVSWKPFASNNILRVFFFFLSIFYQSVMRTDVVLVVYHLIFERSPRERGSRSEGVHNLVRM